MGNGFQFLDIILFAAIAGFFVLRLRKVLGKRTGHEEPPGTDGVGPHEAAPAEEDAENVVALPDRTAEAGDGAEPAAEGDADQIPLIGLAQIRRADKSFDEAQFISGACAAFDTIITAYAAGNKAELRVLLANDVYEDFSGVIDEREQAGTVLETTLVGIKEAQIIEAELQGRTAFVTVKFVSEQMNRTRDKESDSTGDDTAQVVPITDIWTFARNTGSRDPNWTLVATQSPN